MATQKTEQDFLQTSFDLWGKYTQATMDFAMESFQKTVQQSLEMREQIGKVMLDAAKKSQDLALQERDGVLEMSETFNKQARESVERFRGIVTPSEGAGK
jgi:hypothetical protein